MNMNTKVEFAVNFEDSQCENKVKDSLHSLDGVHSVKCSIEKKLVLVETSLPAEDIRSAIEATGKTAVVIGIGDVFNLERKKSDGSMSLKQRRTGDLGEVVADDHGRATFKLRDEIVKVSDIIGRAILVTGAPATPQKRLGCGIVARSAGLFENPKRICECDGVPIWDERNKPLAGAGRRDN
ncbi:unnamed protein product [Darwinula stevensoni]|uniref:HMA domain-containing protein n=1 Tax=Darwinula stevensoni TaxID=69355 RepID=A0A7R8X4R5_9CRUS|nr:unnamed protein product [Darwinula stevensoni]CAG0883956.1 unnamed protein product [Darwinula stevensoni]